jgi:hypothetical protein
MSFPALDQLGLELRVRTEILIDGFGRFALRFTTFAQYAGPVNGAQDMAG